MSKNPWDSDQQADEDSVANDPALEHTDILPPTPMVGGRYRLGRLLGEGGMGAVYEAEHTGLGVKVAVKLLNEMFTSDTNAVSRFKREARAAAAIRHPNIVEVKDTDTDEEGIPFIVMELLEGESLSALLRRERTLPPSVAVLVAGQILSGLAAAHEKGVIHRDLKPGNILLARMEDGSHQVKILDFGISKFFSGSGQDVTATGALVGTPRFMAPEQAKGQTNLDGRVDIYAVGVLLYRMVTGRLPFAARTQDEIIRLILQGNPTLPRRFRPEIPPELEAVILKAMAADREARFPSAHAFLGELNQAMPDAFVGGTIQITSHTGPGLTPGPTPLNLSSPITLRSMASDGATDRSTRPTSPRPRRRSRLWLIPLLTVLLVGAGLASWRLHAYLSREGSGAPRYDGPAVRFGITRYLPEEVLIHEHSTLVEYLSDRLQRPVELKIHEDYVDLSAQLAAGKLDLAGLSSYAWVRAKRKWPRLELLATHVTSGGTSYEGYIVAKADAGIVTLDDLKGKVFCYVGPTSTSGFLYPRALFRRQGMDPDKAFRATRFTGDHLSALKALESGACDGAAVFAGIFFEAKSHGLSAERYTILAKTERIPYDGYCAPPDTPPATMRALREALLALRPGSALARRILGDGSRITGFAPAHDSDYDPVRRIEKYLDASETAARRSDGAEE